MANVSSDLSIRFALQYFFVAIQLTKACYDESLLPASCFINEETICKNKSENGIAINKTVIFLLMALYAEYIKRHLPEFGVGVISYGHDSFSSGEDFDDIPIFDWFTITDARGMMYEHGGHNAVIQAELTNHKTGIANNFYFYRNASVYITGLMRSRGTMRFISTAWKSVDDFPDVIRFVLLSRGPRKNRRSATLKELQHTELFTDITNIVASYLYS